MEIIKNLLQPDTKEKNYSLILTPTIKCWVDRHLDIHPCQSIRSSRSGGLCTEGQVGSLVLHPHMAATRSLSQHFPITWDHEESMASARPLHSYLVVTKRPSKPPSFTLLICRGWLKSQPGNDEVTFPFTHQSRVKEDTAKHKI